jgi:hypothetical protein
MAKPPVRHRQDDAESPSLISPIACAFGAESRLSSIVHLTDLAASYARSASECGWRGDRECLAVHLRDCRNAISAAEMVFATIDKADGELAFGRCRGLVEGVLASLAIPAIFITSPAWKRVVGIAPGRNGAKDAARSEAIRRWPAKASLFARVKDDGRAESALIALAGLLREAPR